MKLLESLLHKPSSHSSVVEDPKIVIEDPKTYFDAFVKRMHSEGHEFEIEQGKGASKESLSFKFRRKQDTKELGLIQIEYAEANKTLTIVVIGGKDRKEDKDKWKPDGIASALLAYTLTLYPNTQQIEGRIRSDNIRAYEKGIKDGLSEEDALKQTPAYKLRAKFGYTNIDLGRWQYPRDIQVAPAQWKTEGTGELATGKSQ